ncbi:MAG: hypothetical protein JWR83_101 [Aeromicrobium sp.]|nr:hypothetical protein [Aeromicrobium sp.]
MVSEADAAGPVDDDPAPGPIRVAEVVLATYRWDAWSESAKSIERRSAWIATVVAVAVAILAAAAGLLYIPGQGRVSAIIYAPVIGWGTRQWLFGHLGERWLRPTLDEVRGLVVPNLVTRIDITPLRNLVTHGGALVPEESTVIMSDRRESAVALVASEYDVKYRLVMPPSGGG